MVGGSTCGRPRRCRWLAGKGDRVVILVVLVVIEPMTGVFQKGKGQPGRFVHVWLLVME